MKTELEKQIELLKKYGITNYTITDNIITVNGSVDLSLLTSIEDKDFLSNVVINGRLDLRSLTSVPNKDFLNNTVINGYLVLNSLTSVPKDFLNNTVINGYLVLNSLTSVPEGFLSNTVINGSIYLNSLTEIPDKDFLSNTVINGSIYLNSLKKVPHKDFLNSTVINGNLDLRLLTEIPYKHFLSNTVIGGSIYLGSLTSIPHKDFLNNTVINGNLYLSSLTSIPDKDFLSNTVINGSLYLFSLTKKNKQLLNSNVKKLKEGYNEEKKYCYFDNILSRVISVSEKKGYIIYITPSGYITQKDNFTAHGKTVKKSIEDLEYKIIAEKLKKEPIHADTIFTVQYYRTLTGACEEGCKQWLSANDMGDIDSILAKDLLPILEKTNAYGLDKFKKLITF
jgi:hypothetical protein